MSNLYNLQMSFIEKCLGCWMKYVMRWDVAWKWSIGYYEKEQKNCCSLYANIMSHNN